jgi:hypothetical protein
MISLLYLKTLFELSRNAAFQGQTDRIGTDVVTVYGD